MTETGFPSILVADDEPSFLESTAELLARDGYRCDTAADADQAIEKLQARRYDLLIADIKMPGNPDLRLVREVERLAQGMPVILVTADPSVDSAVAAFALPVIAYLIKPIKYRDLRRQVDIGLQRSSAPATLGDVVKNLERCIAELRAAAGEGTGAGPALSPDAPEDISPLTIRTLAACLSRLLGLEAVRSGRGGAKPLCQLLDCRQRPVFRSALREVIETLEATKTKFRSRELRDLRLRLQTLLAESAD
ncbi:MAG: response regulator [Pirellulales bacterium]|nr:response regulator [Pirellulales bacterium]